MAADPSLELQCEDQSGRHPLLMERHGDLNSDGHVINITGCSGTSASGSNGDANSDLDGLRCGVGPLTSAQAPVPQTSSSSVTVSNSGNTSLTRRGDSYGRRRRIPLNSGLWISIELVVIVTQIIAAIVVLSFSRHEHPKYPLFEWVIGYTAGCVATLPHVYWRYIYCSSQGSVQEPAHSHPGSSQNNPPESNSYTIISVTPVAGGDRYATPAISRSGHIFFTASPRLDALADRFKTALDCFFAIWFIVGSAWVFGGHSSVADAPNLYRLCVVFLTFSFIGYAVPFILCATICCCLPCIISIMGFREDFGQNGGATAELINALPTYKFKEERSRNREGSEIDSESQGRGGILAAGTDKERTISADDAVCCICLAKYGDGDELRELPCAHFFHVECVDKWLKINARCPLCKSEVGKTPPGTNPGRHQGERQVRRGAAESR